MIDTGLVPLFLPNYEEHNFQSQASANADLFDILIRPGVKLIMPSEQTEDFINGSEYRGEFDRNRPRGSGNDLPSHQGGWTTFSRVFVNDIAEPFMKDEKLRFPVGSVIVRERLFKPADEKPSVVSAMIKRKRGFRPMANDWEFLVIDKDFTRVRRGESTGSCVDCHARTRETDFLFKSYLKYR